MTTDEKLDLILNRLAAIEDKLDLAPAAPKPLPTGGLYRFVRPAVRDVSPWADGRDMTGPDVEEAFKRALHGVNWRGGAIGAAAYEKAWTEIEALKTGAPAAVEPYRRLDPEFAGYGLLVGLFDVASEDRWSFGANRAQREGYAGVTIQSFLEDQFKVSGGPGIA